MVRKIASKEGFRVVREIWVGNMMWGAKKGGW